MRTNETPKAVKQEGQPPPPNHRFSANVSGSSLRVWVLTCVFPFSLWSLAEDDGKCGVRGKVSLLNTHSPCSCCPVCSSCCCGFFSWEQREREILQAAAESAVYRSGSYREPRAICYSPAPAPPLQTPPRSPRRRPPRLRPRERSGSGGPGGLQQNYGSPFKANVLTSLSKELFCEDFLCGEENVYLLRRDLYL